MFLGSSHSVCSFNTKIFDEKLDKKSFNLSFASQSPEGTYFTLKEALEYQKPKLIIFELFWKMLERDDLARKLYTYEFMKSGKIKREFYFKGFSLEDKIKNIRVLKYKNDVFKFFSKRKQTNRDSESVSSTRYYQNGGFTYDTRIASEEEIRKIKEDEDFFEIILENDNVEYIKKIVDICNENKIDIKFLTAPIPTSSLNDNKEKYTLINEKIKKIVEENKVYYIDYNIENIYREIFEDEDFKDYHHLNYSGAKKLNNDMIKMINWRINEKNNK